MVNITTSSGPSDPILPRGFRSPNATYTVFRGVCFDSMQEAACAALLCTFVPNFEITKGETIQIKLGSRYVDFCVNGTLVDYHPVLPFFRGPERRGPSGDFSTRDEYREFLSSLRRCGDDQEAIHRLREETRVELEQRYAERRTAQVRQWSDKPIVFAHSPEEFYLKVLVPHGEELPGMKPVLNLFHAVVRGFRLSVREGRSFDPAPLSTEA